MKPITLPTSPEARAALQKAGWRLDHSGTNSEGWVKDATWLMTIFDDGSVYVQMIGSGCGIGLVAFAEVAAILHMTPVEQRKAEAYSELRDRLMDAAGDLDAAFVLLEDGRHTDAKRHLNAAIGRLVLGGKREFVPVTLKTAERAQAALAYMVGEAELRKDAEDPSGLKAAEEELTKALNAALSGDRPSPIADQATSIQAERGPVVPGIEADRGPGWPSSDPAPSQPRPSEEGGSSPSSLAVPPDAVQALAWRAAAGAERFAKLAEWCEGEYNRWRYSWPERARMFYEKSSLARSWEHHLTTAAAPFATPIPETHHAITLDEYMAERGTDGAPTTKEE